MDDAVSAIRDALLRSAGRFIGLQETQRLLREMEKDYPELVQETLKAAPLGRVASVLRRLLDEQVSIRDLWSILDICQFRGPLEPSNGLLTELTRYGLRSQICFDVAGAEKVVPLLLIEPALEEELKSRIVQSHAVVKMLLDDAVMGRLISVLKHYADQIDREGAVLAVLASFEIRRHLAAALKRAGSSTPVLSYDEVAPDFQVEVVGTIQKAWLSPPEEQISRAKPHLVAAGA